MTFAVLRALHSIIGEALDDIEAVYALHGPQDKPSPAPGVHRDKAPTPDSPGNHSPRCGPGRANHRPTLSTNSLSNVYASPPPSPCIKTESLSEILRQSHLDFPSLDAPCNPASLSEALTQHPDVVAATNRIIAACGQMAATVQTPFLTLCDAIMGYHLPSCMRLFEASHTPEILREAGSTGLHVNFISEKNGVDKVKLAHVLRLLATHHIVRELSPDVFSLNRISSTIDTGNFHSDIHRWTMEGIPERKYENTSGVAAFVGLCSDEIFKSSAYLTETYFLSCSDSTRAGLEPTKAPFCYAFGTAEAEIGFFGWLEGAIEHKLDKIESAGEDCVETGRCSLYAPVKTGNQNAVRCTSSGPAFARDNPNANRFRLERFGKAMSGTCSWETPGAILNCFDWHSLPCGSVVVDVGGGIGSTSMLLASAFSSHVEDGPSLRFIIQDRPVVVEMGEKAWRGKCPEFLDNGTALFQVHDFFAPQPVRQAAVFLLRVVLHDWPDDFARRILLHLRDAAMSNTTLLLGDFILPLACPDEIAGDELLESIQGAGAMLVPPPLLSNLGKASANAYWMDMTMQVMFNSQERTLREIVVLAASAGWKVTRVTKCTGSLFGYIVAVPSTIPPQTCIPVTSAASYRDPAFTTYQSPEAPADPSILNSEVIQSRHKRDERKLIERSSSRCGTPTFGSRMHLSLVEEALSRFGGSFLRSRKSGSSARAGSVSKTTSLKQAITLAPVPPVKKKPSPLSIPPLITSPSSASPTAKVHASSKPLAPTLGQRIMPRRLSLANLRTPLTNHEHPPLPDARTPPSPTSPRPSLRRTSHNQRYLEPLAVGLSTPYPASANLVLEPMPSPPAKQNHASSGHGSSLSLLSSPLLSATRRSGSGEQIQSQKSGWKAPGQANQQPENCAMGRRSSLAQLQIVQSSLRTTPSSPLQATAKVESRKRTKSVASLSSKTSQQATGAIPFMNELGASPGNSSESRVGAGSSRFGGLLSRSGGGTSLRFEKGKAVAMPGGLPDTSSFVDFNLDASIGRDTWDRVGNGEIDSEHRSISVLAAAARIEKKVLRKGSP